MDNRTDFLKGHAIWEKQAKQFFDHNAAAIEGFLGNPFSETALTELMKHFRGQATAQQSFFDFMPQADKSNSNAFQQYSAMWFTMTNDMVNLLQEKIRSALQEKTLPQSLKEFYTLWLSCGEEVYQQWMQTDKFLSAFRGMVNEMFVR